LDGVVTIQELGSIGEFVAAMATLATLAYLAYQIRQSTKVARAELTKDLFLASRSALLEIAGSETLAKFAAETTSPPVGEVEAIRRYQFVNSFFRLYELYFNLSQQGLLDKSIGESYEKVIRLFVRSEMFSAWWEEARRIEYQGDFAAHIDAVVAEIRDAAQQGAAAAEPQRA
jgi:hypothetical protein